MSNVSRISIGAALLIYLVLATAGLRYGLPDQDHFFSYSCDETTWIIGLSRIVPEKGMWNPYPFFHEPPGYLWIYGAGVLAADSWGYLTPDLKRPAEEARRDVYARLHLIGRYIQVVLGTLALLVLAVLAWELFGPLCAVLATAMLAVTPAFVAASTLSTDNIPVMLISLLSLGFLMRDGQQEQSGKRRLFAAAGLAGAAVATKYSAAPLIVPLVYRAWKRPDRLQTVAQCLALALVCFVMVCPFSVLTPRSYWSGAQVIAGALVSSIQGAAQRLLFPFEYPLHFSLGLPYLILGVLAVVRFLRTREEALRCLLLWVGGLVLCAYGVGEKASPSRLLILAPAVVLLISVMASRELVHKKMARRYMAGGILFVTWGLTLGLAVMIVNLRTSLPLQKQASLWLLSTVPPHSTIGLPRMPYFWTPDILNSPNARGDLPQEPFRVTDLEFSITKARGVDYLVISSEECHSGKRQTEMEDFCRWVEEGKDFVLIKTFERDLSWGPWTWHRPANPLGMSDDDLWMSPLKVYMRSASVKPRPPAVT